MENKKGTTHLKKLTLNIEGTTEKVSQFVILLEAVYNESVGANERNAFFEDCSKVETLNNLYTSFLFSKSCSILLARADYKK
jgi:hypothetical protein